MSAHPQKNFIWFQKDRIFLFPNRSALLVEIGDVFFFLILNLEKRDMNPICCSCCYYETLRDFNIIIKHAFAL